VHYLSFRIFDIWLGQYYFIWIYLEKYHLAVLLVNIRKGAKLENKTLPEFFNWSTFFWLAVGLTVQYLPLKLVKHALGCHARK
jgi:hypothetical protein